MASEFMDDMDYDDEFGTSQEQYALAAANAARIEGSGGSEDYYYEEGISDESGILRQQYIQQ
jgi:hypothetical protein